MDTIARLPGRGQNAVFCGGNQTSFRVLQLAPQLTFPELSFPVSSSSPIPDTLFFAGKGPEDRKMLERCFELPIPFLVLGGRWPRKLSLSLCSRASENGMRILGPRSEGIIVPCMQPGVPGNTALLADGGDVLVRCLSAFQQRRAPLRYAFSFGEAVDYSPLEAASSILQSDSQTDFYVFILKELREGRKFLDFASDAAKKGKRTAVLLLRRPQTSSREETAALKQFGVVLLNDIQEIVDGALAFLALKNSGLSGGKECAYHTSSDELSMLIKKEAERAEFTLQESARATSPLLIDVLSGSDSLNTVQRRKQRIEQSGRLPVFSSLADNALFEEQLYSAKIPLIPGIRRCFNALQLVFGSGPAVCPAPSEGAHPTKCPLHPRPTEYDAKVLLRAYDIPVAREALCHSLPEALTAAETIGYPIALKVMSPSILRKTEARVIALDVQNEEELKNAYGRTLEKARIANPSARIRGVLVQEMVHGGTEWRMEYRKDPRFGPVVEMSISGIFGEIFPDGVLRAAPFDTDEALRMIKESKGYPLLLAGWRRERLDVEAFASSLAAFSRLAYCETEIARLDVNPVFVNRIGVLVVDAFIERRGGIR